MTATLAPILLFTYKRLESLKKTIKALQQNQYAAASELYIFSDAAKTKEDVEAVEAVRKYLAGVSGFRRIEIIESPSNKGLANSIISGVSNVISHKGKAIVLEDDLVTTTNFLSFMNQALNYYEDHDQIMSVSGFTMPMKGIPGNNVYFTGRSSSWGWGTWHQKWESIDWKVNDYNDFKKDKKARAAFNKMGSDMCSLLDRQMQGKINSWAIRWCYHQFRNKLLTVYPAVSKVINIGLEDKLATHTNERFSRFKTIPDDSGNNNFLFSHAASLNNELIRQFTKPYSLTERAKYKLLNSIDKLIHLKPVHS